ncbi:MAG: hypothetical protein BA874_01955 [Desulfuromonadales bacterium C00003068]|nr:MAG: hypothetical protein BA874_01955 [Desulfuromonadales bacterium C00003068]
MLTHATNEIAIESGAHARCGLDLFWIEIEYFAHGIGHHSYAGGFIVDKDTDDNDTAIDGTW